MKNFAKAPKEKVELERKKLADYDQRLWCRQKLDTM